MSYAYLAARRLSTCQHVHHNTTTLRCLRSTGSRPAASLAGTLCVQCYNQFTALFSASFVLGRVLDPPLLHPYQGQTIQWTRRNKRAKERAMMLSCMRHTHSAQPWNLMSDREVYEPSFHDDLRVFTVLSCVYLCSGPPACRPVCQPAPLQCSCRTVQEGPPVP